MTMSNQPPPEGAAPPDMSAFMQRHSEEQEAITREDAAHVASLFKSVGNELFTVDHQSVGGNSSIKALKLDKEKVFSAPIVRQQPVSPAQPDQVPEPQPVPEQVAPPVPVHPVEPAAVKPSVMRVKQHVESPSDNHELRIRALEKKVKELSRSPTKKFTVKFKSDSITATIDDFEHLIDSIRKSLNKSSKRITIVRSED